MNYIHVITNQSTVKDHFCVPFLLTLTVMYQIIMCLDGLCLSKLVKLKVTHPLRNKN